MRFITPPDYSDGVAVPVGRTADWRLASWIGHGLWQPDVEAADGRVSGLDAHLGSGWALLALGPGDEAFVGLDPFWDAIGARRVRLLTHAAERSATVGHLELVCRTGAVARVAKELADTQYVVVRPDRYVAAVFPADDERRVVAALREFVDDRRPPQH
jgi:3-(3-hydroxy-phenyl)propionate hydroxylase